MQTTETISGGCMCGLIRYESHAAPMHSGYCHCRSCQHHTGAAVAGMLVFERDDVQFVTGQPSVYASSPGIERGFCPQCGTSLSWQGHGLISLHIGTLDNPDMHPPTLQWRDEERSAWCDAGRDLPKVKMTFPTSDIP